MRNYNKPVNTRLFTLQKNFFQHTLSAPSCLLGKLDVSAEFKFCGMFFAKKAI